MERTTFERALHMWADWGESIINSRLILGYDPKWSKEQCLEWINRNYYPSVREQGEAELRRLELPPTLQEYWEDCFYSDYQAEDGSINYSKITRCLSDRRSLPELPCEWAIVHYNKENLHDPWLRIEIRLHAGFATKEVFNYAAKWGFETVKEHLRQERIGPHPVARNINKAKVESPSWRALALKEWQRTEDIDETLRRLYFAPEVQTNLEMKLSHRQTDYERRRIEKESRKHLRDRVTSCLKRAGIAVPRPKTRWWLPEQ
jgi:hypothetical protein